MEQNKTNQPKNEEIDLIQLLEYFKNGIKSVFKRIGKIIGLFIQIIILLKKNWILVVSFILLGALYGAVIKPLLSKKNSQQYEFVLKGNSLSNMELYSIAKEINNTSSETEVSEEETKMTANLNISRMNIEPIERDEDVINNYFEQIELNMFRGLMTDTLYFQVFNLKSHKSNLLESDYALQKVNLTLKEGVNPQKIQEQLFAYLKNSHKINTEQEIRLNLLKNHERRIERAIDNIDSLMGARVSANKNASAPGSDQMMVNTAYRNNVERDLLDSYDLYSKRLYSVQTTRSNYESGFSIVSNIHAVKETGFLGIPAIKFSILGFLFSLMVVLGIQINHYLNRYAEKHNLN